MDGIWGWDKAGGGPIWFVLGRKGLDGVVIWVERRGLLFLLMLEGLSGESNRGIQCSRVEPIRKETTLTRSVLMVACDLVLLPFFFCSLAYLLVSRGIPPSIQCSTPCFPPHIRLPSLPPPDSILIKHTRRPDHTLQSTPHPKTPITPPPRPAPRSAPPPAACCAGA